MLSSKQISLFASLKQKKHRLEYNKTLVEGLKPVQELLNSSYPIERILLTEEMADKVPFPLPEENLEVVSSRVISRISTQKQPEGILAIIPIIRENQIKEENDAIYLYRVNDPGNLGTVIRTAAYFNIRQIFLSPDSVDPWNPKVIRGSMGSFFYVSILENLELEKLIREVNYHSIIATTPHGKGITGDSKILSPWILIMGSESHGLPEEIIKLSTHQFTIMKPGYGESLNLSVSVGIILHYLLRDSEKEDEMSRFNRIIEGRS